MTLEESIEILEAACNHEERFDEEELWYAQKLGIEALKNTQYLRTIDYRVQSMILPGETPSSPDPQPLVTE